MALSFYFTVEILSPGRDVTPRRSRTGNWLPPKARGNNVKFSRQTFYYNSTRQPTVRTAALPAVPNRTSFKAYSIYYCRGRIHGIDYDAAESRVHNGREVEHSDDPDSDESDSDGGGARRENADWQELGFCETSVENRWPKLSYAAAGAEEENLLAQRSDQLWARYLLPEQYQRRWDMTADHRRGGMVGPLPLLIGLTAMSLPSNHWADLLPYILVNSQNGTRSWHLPATIAGRIAPGSLWRDRTGVVVTVYLDPGGTSRVDLLNHERGRFGPIFA